LLNDNFNYVKSTRDFDRVQRLIQSGISVTNSSAWRYVWSGGIAKGIKIGNLHVDGGEVLLWFKERYVLPASTFLFPRRSI
jgi:hypothetical protein